MKSTNQRVLGDSACGSRYQAKPKLLALVSQRLCALRTFLISLPLLAGCATPIVEESASTVTTAQDAVVFEAMRFTDLVLATAVRAGIDAKSPIYVVDGSPRRFAAFALPTDPSRRYLDFVSTPFGGIMIDELKTLVPVFTFLGADRRVIKAVEAGHMEGSTPPFQSTRFEGRVAVPQDARYVVVHGTDRAPAPLIVHGGLGTLPPFRAADSAS